MTLNKYKGTRVEIDLDNLAFNMRSIRRYIDKDTMIMAVVKGNAYGHGAIAASRVFLENGADMLAVSLFQEAVELRKAGIDAPILTFNYIPHYQYDTMIENDIMISIYNYEDALFLSNKAKSMNKHVKIHIKIDTGMSRVGFLPNEESTKDIIKISKLPNIEIQGIYSHFAAADEKDKTFTKKQYNRFNLFIKKLKDNNINIPIKHISNSAGVIDYPEYNLDMVRPGIISYGYYPSTEVDVKKLSLKPAMTFKTNVAYLKTLPKGTGIGYNQEFITNRQSKIATISVGYADGYYRLLTGKGEVYIDGERAPIVGKICMDQMMVDVTDIKDIKREDEVILFGYKNKKHPHIEEIAKLLGTTFYEVTTIISRRVPKVYLKDGKYDHIVDYIFG
ncbi:MAG TPA: alanine racemase [Tissierellaceae bacterium]|nr:alanine racemase [Tissierellaceae bacterium]